jgi:hypothetical protein
MDAADGSHQMLMPTIVKAPVAAELKAALGAADAVWQGIVQAIGREHAPLAQVWKPAKTGVGRMCLLQHKKRTLLYLIPDWGKIWVAVVLGERAYQLALASTLPAAIKQMFTEARPYAEGRGIRFAVDALSDLPVILKLVELKTTPRDGLAR